MYDEEVKRVIDLLEEACHHSRRSRRDLERTLGVANGYLSHLFSGRLDLKMRHVFQLTTALGIDAGRFLRGAFPTAGEAPASPDAAAPPPSVPPLPAATSPAPNVRELLRELIRSELVSLLAESAPAAVPAKPDGEETPRDD